MSDPYLNDLERKLLSSLKSTINLTKVGFEKESLRVCNDKLSNDPHPKSLGSALCNSLITTDFSEAQLELVTPPIDDKKKAINILDNIHHFVSHNIGNETIWPFSMPNTIKTDDDISIASYGLSNNAKFKELYRSGLSQRYGKMMQSISGFHFNYSVPSSFWNDEFFRDIDGISKNHNTRSSLYLNMLRNIYRFNWMIIYLYGASPVATKYFLANSNEAFKSLDKNTLYLPNATSLRMSSYGYQNKRRKRLQVSLNSISEYVSDLRKATSTHHPEFSKPEFDHQSQINDYVLQIDDEYYAVARAKSSINSDLRTTTKLKNGGIDFIELRSLDLNPFSRVGIDEETMCFLEVFLAYCFIRQSDYFSNREIDMIDHNDELVAISGRQAGLEIHKDDRKIKLKEWGNILIDELFPIAEVLDSKNAVYSKALKKAKEKFDNQTNTLSSRFMDMLSSSGNSFISYGLELSKKNKEYYLNKGKSENEDWKMLEKEAKDSIKSQNELESRDKISFKDYIEEYYKQ